jgi:RHS repeat-associated protein
MLAAVSMLSMMWHPSYALPGDLGGRRPSNGTARAGSDWVLTRLAPVAAEWRRPEGNRAATFLFDDDQSTSMRTGGDAQIRVSLAGPRPIRGIGVFGRAEGRLSISTVDDGRETPVVGLQDLDLRALPLRWNRFWASGTPQVAGELALRWRPGSATEVLPDLEIFGDGPDVRADQGPALADRVVAGTASEASEAWAEPEAETISSAEGIKTPRVFHLPLSGDPRLMGRTFLVYELAGRPHWSAVRRQVNGFSVQGGFGDEQAAGGLQVEEISPEWLSQGDNEIRFFPGEDADLIGYRVGRVRIVSVPGTNDPAGATEAVQPTPPAGSDLARLSDGNPESGVRAGRGWSAVVLPLARGAQPSAVTLHAVEPLEGRVLAATIRSDGKLGPQQELDVAGLGPGWHTLPLDRLAAGNGVRFTWSPGREGTGFISELRLGSSPRPEGVGRRLVVSYPLHGECVDHRVYVTGFVTGQGAETKRPLLLADGGAVQPGIAADGAFSFVTPEPAAFRGRSWSIALRARFADGGELRGDVAVEACTDRPLLVSRARKPGEPRPLVEDEGAPYGKMVDADEGAALAMGGARIDIPAGALEHDMRVTIRPIGAEQVAPLDDPLMENITRDRKAFRFGPHNLTFGKPARVSIPFDRGLVGEGVEPDELGVFFFDDELGRWQRLPTERDGRLLVAETTHFTDFIAATLKRPDHPTSAMNTPNMIRDLKVGDPTAGMTIIQPPVANSDGAAHLTFPIDIPPGRNGLQPKIELEYSSDGGNGLLGMGWSYPLHAVEVDTKMGVNEYDQNHTRYPYLLEGDEIIPVAGQGDLPKDFKRRVEGPFEKITRPAGNTSAWEVTDKNGTKREYGRIITPTIRDEIVRVQDNTLLNGDSVSVYFPLLRVTDTFGNVIEYNYIRQSGGGLSQGDSTSNATWLDLMPGSIFYTSNPGQGQPARFRITHSFGFRPDPFSTARLGREMRTRQRLEEMTVDSFDTTTSTWKIYRRYKFDYQVGEFGKSLLTGIRVDTGNSSSPLYTHRFDYQKIPRGGANNRPAFRNPMTWGSLQGTGAIGRGSNLSAGVSGFAGIGPGTCYPHVGAGMSGSGSSDSTSEVFMDINGDGLPDVLRADGRAFLNGFSNGNRAQGLFTSVQMTGLDPLSQSVDWSRTFAAGFHLPGEFGLNGSRTDAHSVQTKGIVDMNGDGLPDFFSGNQLRCNRFPGSTCSCAGFPGTVCTPPTATPTAPFASAVSWTGGDTSSFLVFSEPPQHGPGAGNSSFKAFPFARWIAPYSGTVNIVGQAQRWRIQTGDNPPVTDPVTAYVYLRRLNPPPATGITERFLWAHEFPAAAPVAACEMILDPNNPNMQTACGPSNGSTINVRYGDQLYFIVGSASGVGNKRNTLLWNPTIRYTDVPCPDLANFRTCFLDTEEASGGKLFSFEMSADFRLAGGPYKPWVSASADTTETGVRLTPTSVVVTGTINKKSTTADNLQFRILRLRNGTPTVVWTSDASMPFEANETGTFALNQTIDVQGRWAFKDGDSGQRGQWTVDGDQLVFQALADSPFDPAAFDWKPVVTYRNFCRPNPVRQAEILRTNSQPNPSLIPIECTNTPSDFIGTSSSQAAEVQVAAFRTYPDDPSRPINPLAAPTRPQPIYLFTDNANHNIQITGTASVTPFSTTVGAPDGTMVVLLVQTPDRLLAKQIIPITGTAPFSQAFNTGTLSLPGNVPLYFTAVAYGTHFVNWRPTVTIVDSGQQQTFTATLRMLAEAPLPGILIGRHGGPVRDPMSGGFHGWSFGIHNGDMAFSTAAITVARTNANPSFVPAMPASRGLGLNDGDLPSSGGPVWAGRAGDDYIAGGEFHPSFTGAGAIAKSPPGTGFRRSTSENRDGGLNIGVSFDQGSGTTRGEMELVDMNGDMAPDLVGINKVLVNNVVRGRQTGYAANARSLTFPFGDGAIRKVINKSRRWGVGLGSIASQIVTKPAPGGDNKDAGSNLPSFGLTYGISKRVVDLIDINGDGLPDAVEQPQPPEAPGTLRFRLGLGLQSGIAFQPAATVRQADQTLPLPLPALASAAFGSFTGLVPNFATGTSSEDVDALQLQNNANNSLQINIMGMGGGLAHGVTRTLVQMMDLNGDGLPDRVMKLPGNTGVIYVQFNYGLGFTAQQAWDLPSWDTSIDTFGMSESLLGNNDALAFSQTRSLAVSGGGIIPIPLLLVCLVLEGSINGDTITNNSQMSFEDVDGDGAADHVYKRDDLSALPGSGSANEVRVKLSPIGAADKLIRVEGPVGGSFDISYTRAGNTVNHANHVDVPTNHWVMSRVVVHNQPSVNNTAAWNAEPDRQMDFKYADGFHDRNERVFLGWKTVTTTQPAVTEQLVVQETYDTSDVYHKGRLLKRVERRRFDGDGGNDDALPVLNVAETQYETRVLQAASSALTEDRDVRFVIDKVRLFRSYELGTADPNDPVAVTRKETRDYSNVHGGVTSFEDDAGTSATSDDIKYVIGYQQDTVRNIFKPNSVTAQTASGTQLAQRSATYFTNGKMNTLSDSLVGGRNPATGSNYTGTISPTWTFNYDNFGNVKDVTDPTGYKITVTAFDGTTISYPVTLSDSFGYQWQQKNNILTGQLSETQDPNGAKVTYTFDERTRLSAVSDTAGMQLVSIAYLPPVMPTASNVGQPAGALVSYNNAEASQTLSLADGWGRVMQTKKRASIDDGAGNSTQGLTISGRMTLDAYGRVVQQGQPVFQQGQLLQQATTFDPIANKNPTKFRFDALSRETRMDLPIASGARANITRTTYDQVLFNGVLRQRKTVKDANQFDSEVLPNSNPFPGQTRETYRDGRGRVTAVVEQNRIAGTVKPLVTEYEYDQLDRLLRVFDAKENKTEAVYDSMSRIVSLTNPDTGRTRYDYHAGGPLGRKETANAKIIQYQYNFNRLEHIVYPNTTAVDLIYGSATAPNGGVGRVIRRVDETGATDFQYDGFGALKKTTWAAAPQAGATAQPAYVTDYVFEPVFNTLRTLTSDGETYTYSYDVGGHVRAVSGRRGTTTTTYASKILYNEFDQRTRLELGNGAVTTYGYDPLLRRLTAVDTVRSGVAIQKMRYTSYDFVGNIKRLENQVPTPSNPATGVVTPGPTVQTFTYDNLHQLTAASGTYTGLGSLGGRTYSLAIDYDDIGNITRKNQTDRNRATVGGSQSTVAATSYNNAYTYGGGTTRPHAATAIGSQAASYDNDGNQLSLLNAGVGRTATWNEDDRMKTITAAGETTTFFYASEGERAIKRGNTETHYPNPYLAARVAGSKTHNVMVGDERIASVVIPASGAATTFYYHSDHLQSSNYTSDGAGNLTQHNEYFPSGETWVEELRGTGSGALANRQPYKFNSKELDATGLYDFGARYYDPRQSQWVNPDPMMARYMVGEPNMGVYLPSNLGLYTYTFNNPVVLRDPDGRFVHILIGAGLGAVIGGGARLAGNLASGRDWSEGVVASAVGGAVTGGLAAGTGGASLAAEIAGAGLAATIGGGVTRAIETGGDPQMTVENMVGDFAAGATGAAAVRVIAPAIAAAGRASVSGAATEAGAAEGGVVKEGIYEFFDQQAGKPYVGQSSNIPARLEQHVKAGRIASPKDATTKSVPGGKTAREIAEHKRIQEITGGVPARMSNKVANKVDPIGPKRAHLLK